MASNWAIPRQVIIETALAGLRRGWLADASEAADRMVSYHYQGVDPNRAQRMLERDILQVWWSRHAGRTADQERIVQMAAALRDEGWRLISNELGDLWVHDASGLAPNRNGSTFAGYGDATEFVFNSATREYLKEEV